MRVSAPKFEAVFNGNGRFFRLLQDSFHPTEYVDGLIAERHEADGFVTYIVDDALVHYMKMSFKRLMEGRRKKFPNYKIIGLSRSGFTPFDVPASKIVTPQAFEARIEHGTVVCGSTQLKRKMVIGTMLDLKQKYCIETLLYFISYSDAALVDFAATNDLPMALMGADMVGPMAEYFGSWKDWYYLRCSYQDRADIAMVNSRTCEIAVPSAYKAGVGDHSFFKQSDRVEDWIATHTSLNSGQVRNANVRPDPDHDVEVYLNKSWVPSPGVDVNWGGLGRGRDDSFGWCDSEIDYGLALTLRVRTSVKGVYYCGIFMRHSYFMNGGKRISRYTPLPVKNQDTLNAINTLNGTKFE